MYFQQEAIKKMFQVEHISGNYNFNGEIQREMDKQSYSCLSAALRKNYETD